MRLRFTILLILLGFFLQAQTLVQYDRDSLQRVRNPFTRDWDLVRRNMDDPGNKFTVKFVKDSFNAVINPYSPEREFNLVRRETAGEGSFILPFNKSLYDVVNNPFTGHYDLLEKPASEPETSDLLILEWDDIANVPVADAESVTDWNAFFGLPEYGTEFTSVTVSGNTIYLFGGSDITLKPALFTGDGRSNLLRVADSCSSIDSIAITSSASPFFNKNTLQSCGMLNYIEFPNLLTIGDSCFYDCASLSTILIPSCFSIGSTADNNSVFMSRSGGMNIVTTFDTVILTCNSGAPDGDLCTLAASNTITVNGAPLSGCP